PEEPRGSTQIHPLNLVRLEQRPSVMRRPSSAVGANQVREVRADAYSGARIGSFGDLARRARLLADDHGSGAAGDDLPHPHVLVPFDGEELVGICANALVPLDADGDPARAVEPVALADDVKRLILRDGESALKPLDTLVDLPEDGFVGRLAPLAFLHRFRT